ncbi:hypothetical protein pipiens_000138, partial [Culex pipiens pipiens]
MTKFWECEDGGFKSDYSVEESTCEDHYVRTVKRGGDATPEEETEDCAKERRKHVESAAAVSAKSFNESYFGKFNEYWKLIRTTAYWRRYLRNRLIYAQLAFYGHILVCRLAPLRRF